MRCPEPRARCHANHCPTSLTKESVARPYCGAFRRTQSSRERVLSRHSSPSIQPLCSTALVPKCMPTTSVLRDEGTRPCQSHTILHHPATLPKAVGAVRKAGREISVGQRALLVHGEWSIRALNVPMANCTLYGRRSTLARVWGPSI